MSTPKTIKIDNVEYVRASDVPAPKPNGNRCVVVVDRGWIFAGDVTESNGRIRLARAVNLRHFSGVGFEGAVANPKSDKVTICPVADVDMPADAELFRVPVSDDWGL